MTHAEASEQLSAYLDGELTDAERAELESQLARDPALRSELQQIEAAIAFLRTHGPVQAPPDFRAKVLDAVKDEPMPGGWWRWLRRPFGLPIEGLAVALAAALVLIVALPLGLHKPATQVRDLAREPYGFVSGEETRPAPASSAAPQAAEQAAQQQPQGTTSARPEVQGTSNAPVVVTTQPEHETVSTRPQAPRVPKERAATAPNDRSGLAEASKQAQAPAPPPAPGTVYAYKILTRDAGALTGLKRIAAHYRGQVLDARGQPATGPLQTGETYVVEIPADSLAPFGDDLRTLGMVREIPQPSGYAGGVVKVQIAFDLVPDETKAASPASDATQ